MKDGIYGNISELIGSTPLLELGGYAGKIGACARILVKLENRNPAGSIKDRVALNMLNEAERSGRIGKNTVIIEPTSGNTGIGLAALCAVRGYRLIIVMPDSMSMERRKLMTAYGAELILTPGALGMAGAVREAERIASENKDSFIAGQFVNPANPAAHYKTTGPEIYSAVGDGLGAFVAGAGTGGTVTGVGRYMKEHCPSALIVVAEPAESAVLSGGKAGAHGIQGIGAGFVPKALDTGVYDEVIAVTDEDSISEGKALARAEAFLTGISSGAAMWAARQVAMRKEAEGKRILVLLPDSGDRYLSTALFA